VVVIPPHRPCVRRDEPDAVFTDRVSKQRAIVEEVTRLKGIGEDDPEFGVAVAQRLEDTPGFINFPGENGKVHYGEGLFVGYRYYDKKEVEPLFPFGFGLSYTSFEYRDLKVPKAVRPGEPVPVELTVKNTGRVAGREVVQLYVADLESSLPRPAKELKGFEKIRLRPGESRKVRFVLDARALSFYDPSRKEWVLEPGRFEVQVGSSSRHIRLRRSFDVRAADHRRT
jgi:beta-glucosidase